MSTSANPVGDYQYTSDPSFVPYGTDLPSDTSYYGFGQAQTADGSIYTLGDGDSGYGWYLGAPQANPDDQVGYGTVQPQSYYDSGSNVTGAQVIPKENGASTTTVLHTGAPGSAFITSQAPYQFSDADKAPVPININPFDALNSLLGSAKGFLIIGAIVLVIVMVKK
jgi:hypothetical protein